MRLPKRFSAFTLIEVLIVVGIMGIMTVAALPSFGDFADRRTFQNNVDIFAENVRSARNKAISGVAISGKDVSWKITPINGSNSYEIGYIITSDSSVGVVSTKTLAGSGSVFECTDDVTPLTACKIVFERLTGKRISGTAGESQSIKIKFGTDSRIIKVYETGKMVIQ